MYTQLAEIPVPVSGHFVNENVVQVFYSVKDHIRNAKRTMSKTIVLTKGESYKSPLQDVGDVVLSVTSPSKKRRAVLREVKSDGKDAKRLVEVWLGDRLETTLDVSERHGTFYADESYSTSYSRFRFVPDLGEGLSGKKKPTLFVLRWDHSASDVRGSTLLEQIVVSEPAWFGQAVFSPNTDDILYATGYECSSDGRLLGIKGCFNRPSGIWQLRLQHETESDLGPERRVTAQKITPSHLSCRSPRILVSENICALIWFSCKSGGPHMASTMLYGVDIRGEKEPAIGPETFNTAYCLIDPVPNPKPSDIPGLFPSYNLPASPTLQIPGLCEPGIIFHSQWGSRTSVLLAAFSETAEEVSVVLAEVTEDNLDSWSVLATDGKNRVLCQRSNPTNPYQIVLGELNSSGEATWAIIDEPDLSDEVQDALSGVRFSVVPIAGHHPTETLVVQPPITMLANGIPPCITAPHGGPHAATTTAFSAATTALVLEGYTISLVNYTGSTGYGEDAVQALIGKCGTLDVEDCIASSQVLVKLGIAEEGPGKQFVMGGSHGGFLTAHLIGQYPDVFTAAVLRNPVISCGDITGTDIPDWYYSEFGFPYPIFSSPLIPSSPPARPPILSAAMYEQLNAMSPIAHVEKVKAPVLLLIGAADRRVSPNQGIGYYHALRGLRGEGKGDGKVEMMIFEGESHPLDGVEAAKVGWEAGRDWFAESLKNLTKVE
ncbi:Alpha/Beta hydrolase protein [Cyathus striatus]|nr:Alpha/Beta hydrolase protein [Cyathus striatus]